MKKRNKNKARNAKQSFPTVRDVLEVSAGKKNPWDTGQQNERIVEGLKFRLTCHACPEQYEVFTEDNKQVAYVRLRHGDLSCRCPDHYGEYVYSGGSGEGEFFGDGCFDTEEDREKMLPKIAQKINEWRFAKKKAVEIYGKHKRDWSELLETVLLWIVVSVGAAILLGTATLVALLIVKLFG